MEEDLINKAIPVTGALLVLSTALYLGLTLDLLTTQEDTPINIQMDDSWQPGGHQEIQVVEETGDGVQGANVYVNDESMGLTNQQGKLTVPVPEDATTATVRIEADEGEAANAASITTTPDTTTEDDDGDSTGTGTTDSDGDDGDSTGTGTTGSDGDDGGYTPGQGDDDDAGDVDLGSDDDEDGTDDGDDDTDGTDDSDDDDGFTGDLGGDDEEDEVVLEASFTHSPDGSYEPGNEITFDASSTEHDHQIDSYEWSEDIQDTGETTTQTFDSSGQKYIQLEVTDTEGNTDTDAEFVNIGDTDEETASIVINNPSGDEEPLLEYDVEIADTPENAEYTIMLEETEISSGNLDEGYNQLEPEHEVSQTGTLDTTVTVTLDEETIAEETQGVTLDREYGDLGTINIIQPEGSIEDTEATSETEITTQTDTTLNLYVDDDQVESTNLDEGYDNTYTHTVDPEQGTYTFEAELEKTSTGEQTSQETTFTIEQSDDDWGEIQSLNNPNDGATIEDYQVDFEFDIQTDDIIDYTLYIDGSEETGGATAGGTTTETISFDDTATRDWYVEIENDDEDTKTSETRTFENTLEQGYFADATLNSPEDQAEYTPPADVTFEAELNNVEEETEYTLYLDDPEADETDIDDEANAVPIEEGTTTTDTTITTTETLDPEEGEDGDKTETYEWWLQAHESGDEDHMIETEKRQIEVSDAE